MKIALVIDLYDVHSNGTSVSAQRFVECLRARGHEVRIVTAGSREGPDIYHVPAMHIPFFQGLIEKEGFVLAKGDEAVLRRAFEGVDLVHVYLPLLLGKQAVKVAHQMNIPVMAAFHMQPEHVSWNIGLRGQWAADALYKLFERWVFGKVDHIHCPTPFMARELEEHGYQAALHPITNGVDPIFTPGEGKRPAAWKDKIVILMVGRYSVEKRQDVLIQAVAASRYADRIQLVLAGTGPQQYEWERLGEQLPNRPVMDYYSKEDLVNVIRSSDLYVHAADVESEAISCIEAFACGLVPVISNSPHSATGAFALDERSLFAHGDPQDLARKIDYWIEHPQERAAMSRRYAQYGESFSVEASVAQIEEVYRQTIEDEKAKLPAPDTHLFHPQKKSSRLLDPDTAYINHNPFFELGQGLIRLLAMLILTPLNWLGTGVRIEGRENLSELDGAVVVCNHAHMLDSLYVSLALFPRMVQITTLQANEEMGLLGKLIRLLGGVPIPDHPQNLQAFMGQMGQAVGEGEYVQFYPECALWPYYEKLRPFKNGAFRVAVDAGVPVLPVVVCFRPVTGWRRLFRRKPLITVRICPPQYPAAQLSHRAQMNELRERTWVIMDAARSGLSEPDAARQVQSA